MDEKSAIIGVFIITLLSVSMFFVINNMNSGAAVVNNYKTCECKFLIGNEIIKTKVSGNYPNCDVACYRYADQGQLLFTE